MKQELIDDRYLRMAHIWAENSYARKLQVGALIVKDRTIISDGYNGTPVGFDNNCETEHCEWPYSMCEVECSPNGCEECQYNKLKTKPEVLHAEANAITKLAKSTQSGVGATIYITDSPCIECAKLIIQTGIVRVVFDRLYSKDDGINLLKRAGIEVVQHKING